MKCEIAKGVCYCQSGKTWNVGCPEFQCQNETRYGPSCQKPCKCQNARCNYDGKCSKKCYENHEGSNCETCKCKNEGTCEKNKCLCTDKFEGKLCEKRKCKNGGTLIETGECQCPGVYEDGFCETCKCQNGGSCSDSKCSCPPNHEGNLCQNKKCKNGESTKEFGKCQCPKIFAGELCENCLCKNGECSNDKCNCPENFEGELCEFEKFKIERSVFYQRLQSKFLIIWMCAWLSKWRNYILRNVKKYIVLKVTCSDNFF